MNFVARLLFGLLLLVPLSFAAPTSSFDTVRCQQAFLGVSASVQQAQTRAEALLARRGQLSETLDNPWPEELTRKGIERRHPEKWTVRGVPSNVRRIDHKGMVFRHYTAEAAALESIKSSSVLRSGHLPYVTVAPGVYKKLYKDLSGVFLTLPKAAPDEVGLERGAHHYVDVHIPAEVPVLELEPGRIYVIPLKANVQAWVKEGYLKYKAGQPVSDPTQLKMYQALDEAGGVDEAPAAIPIEIIGTGLVR